MTHRDAIDYVRDLARQDREEAPDHRTTPQRALSDWMCAARVSGDRGVPDAITALGMTVACLIYDEARSES